MTFQLVVKTCEGFKIEKEVLFEGESYDDLLKVQCKYIEAAKAKGLKEEKDFSFRIYGKDSILNKWREMFWV